MKSTRHWCIGHRLREIKLAIRVLGKSQSQVPFTDDGGLVAVGIMGGAIHLVDLEAPIEIVWGVNDPIFGERLSQMMEIFPDAPVTRTEAGHFLQEEVDAPEQIAAAIQRVRDGLRG